MTKTSKPGRPRTAGRTATTGRTDRAARPQEAGAVTGAGISRQLFIQATQALGAVLAFEYPADAVLSRHFRDNRELGHRDRGFIAEAVYGVLRRLRWLRRLAGAEATPRMLLLAWFARGEGWPMRNFEGLVSATESDWLASVKAADAGEMSLAERVDLPDWLAERLLQQMDEAELVALAHGLNRPAPLDLRVNLLKADRDAVLAQLQAGGVAAEPGRLSPQAIRLAAKPALQKHPLFLDGSFEVQDEGSQLLGLLVQPRRGELVVDFCAGAGGKTLQLGALMRSTGRLYAFDVSDKRLAKLKPRMARAGLSNVHPVLIAHEADAKVKRLAGKADRVLVDAPCTGLGTLRRNPDLKWRQSPAAVEEMVAKQGAILAAAARLVRPGGRLVYATCSLLAEENDAIVDAFLAAHPGFAQLSAQDILDKQGVVVATGERLRLMPHVHDTDGFFAAVMERRAEA
ncbi:RsmB/NOP family class I SAM-dependent RNA methyltransferase [Thauera mechernichensis]|uniref:RsmB/NOP family class I SAM-dependent RNA methyltransferase n=1 Tax=Thauera mechernichensis TaxID=82788 RepID=A0ABW3WEN2_9RHOO|nr:MULTISPECIES: RsmB/NOP family class I SAM-dependent RNA methyltransferase [Thauera]MDG3063797.1 RsmB/NOP family class I SAM-dependent RNA methyltransferase [Thauera mechernichensis]WBL65626.1 RsmB/NOP family class I SAM-dependent RNA methyltransferase [Thauera sp. WB-2]HNR61297.1 RsmB/NOP family class I SAM-dependent RNA methyltransferase [Thauera sp.]HNS92538.1 RsmB/NOP family class I SAM-dependent RNA methyltransferase [Thauera sp.]HRK09757.1 RsmB/NOP family class I SAM-dependent RNA meth